MVSGALVFLLGSQLLQNSNGNYCYLGLPVLGPGHSSACLSSATPWDSPYLWVTVLRSSVSLPFPCGGHFPKITGGKGWSRACRVPHTPFVLDAASCVFHSLCSPHSFHFTFR